MELGVEGFLGNSDPRSWHSFRRISSNVVLNKSIHPLSRMVRGPVIWIQS